MKKSPLKVDVCVSHFRAYLISTYLESLLHSTCVSCLSSQKCLINIISILKTHDFMIQNYSLFHSKKKNGKKLLSIFLPKIEKLPKQILMIFLIQDVSKLKNFEFSCQKCMSQNLILHKELNEALKMHNLA